MIDAISTNMFANDINRIKDTAPAFQPNDVNKTTPGGGFKEMLGNLISDVDNSQKGADIAMEDLATGSNNTTIQDVVMKMEEADISFQLMKEIRNKLLSAYRDILKL